MSKNVRTQIGKVIGKTLNSYHARVKPVIDDIKFKEQYQGRIIDCMVGEVDDNYIETPEIDSPIVKLEHSKEGLVKVPSIKGKTILVDADGNETDTPAEGCKLVSVGEDEDNKLIILSKNKNLWNWNDLYNQYGTNNPNLYKKFNGTLTKINNDEYSITPYSHGWYEQGIFSTPIYLKSGDNISFSGTVKGCRNATVYEISDFLRPVSNVVNFDENSNEYKSFNTSCTVDKDGYYVARFWISNNCKAYVRNIQFEKSPTSTNYVEPKQHKTEILLDEPLRGLPNGVCDEIVGNKIIRRLGILTFNGTEKSWEDWDENSIVLREKYFSDGKESGSGFDVRGHSNQYTWGSANTPNTFRYYKIGTVLWTMFGKDYPLQSLNEFKEKIGKHPIQVVYELAEPVVIEMPNALTLQGFDDTTMYVENSITPTVSYGYNALITYKEELRTQKEEVETNTLDIENNIIPYLMDMEFNLMLMEDNE